MLLWKIYVFEKIVVLTHEMAILIFMAEKISWKPVA